MTSGDAVEVEFHRPWLGKRKIAGRLKVEPVFYEPSPALVARPGRQNPVKLP